MIHYGIIRVTAILLLSSGQSFADGGSPWSVLVAIGMNGTWALSCKAPASSANYWITYQSGADNRVWRILDRGPSFLSMNIAIDSAQIITPTTIETRMRNDDPHWGSLNGGVYDVVTEISNNRMRTLESIAPDGTQLIKNGVKVQGEKPLPTLEKCST
jgi:hypothetical protein